LVETLERERVDVKELILETARELFIELGYEGVSLRKVATRIGYSATTIYLYFADKEALFFELCSRDFAKLAAEFQKLNTIADPAERLKACGRAYVEFAVTHPNHYRLMFMTKANAPLDRMRAECPTNPDENAYLFLRSLVADCMKAGLFRPELTDVDLVSQTLWAGTHGVAALEITACMDGSIDWRSIQERTDFMLQSIVHGMGRTPERTEK
jgi:AcrR family transcriptional regulator